MKRTLLAAVLLALGSTVAMAEQGGYTGPSSTATTKGGYTGPKSTGVITVAQAKQRRDDSKVVLRGKIANKLGDEKYLFKDSSGEIVIEIDDDDWNGLTIGPNDQVEIYGEVNKDHNSVEIEVDGIRKVN